MSITPADYLKGVLRTANLMTPFEQQVDNCLVSIQGEWGEVANYLKKTLYHGKEFQSDVIIDEFGDILFYIFWLNYALNTKFTGNTFKFIFASQFETCASRFKGAQTTADYAYNVLQCLSILNARSLAALNNFKLGRGISSTFQESIESSSQALLRALCLIGLHCDMTATWAYVAQKNLDKLRKRYPRGFSVEDSENRRV